VVPFGKYLLQKKLAEGGMAEIFLARQAGIEGFERQVVVKRLLPELTAESDFVRMFLNEARLAARLNHPNIVQIYELGQEEGAYYLAMEYINGEDLRGLAQQADTLGLRPSVGIVCRIISEILAGLHYAHTRTGPEGQPLGLVHRDISPQNILVTYDGGVKIIDFGIAKATQMQSSDQTQAGLLKGKYAYMSPEQTRSGQLDARSDVFSAGILLWELLTWRRLFKRGTDLATLVAVSDEPAPPVSLISPELPKELDPIVLRALAIEPEARYRSALEFQEALEDYVCAHNLEADTRALRLYMRELFKDRLQQMKEDQEREEAAQNGVPDRPRPVTGPGQNSGRRGLPLMTLPLQTLDAAAQQRPQPPAPAQPPPQPAPQPPPKSSPGMPLQAVAAPQPYAPIVTGPQPLMPPQSGPQPLLPTPLQSGPHEALTPQRRVMIAVVCGLILGVVSVLLLQSVLGG
jgi:serine/threonine protein kinase